MPTCLREVAAVKAENVFGGLFEYPHCGLSLNMEDGVDVEITLF